MCGIAGWLDRSVRGPSPQVLRAMTDALRHRGPDGEGYFEDGPIHLGHRRLSIIDLMCGAQPIANEDRTVQLIFNGEIYNHLQLRRELEGRGHQFTTRSDTEVIVHLYEEKHERCFESLRGQFAIAIWDATQRRLVLGRDRMGEKPLFFHASDSSFVFASELKSLLQHPSVPRKIDLRAVDELLAYNYIPEPRSIIAGVAKLPPAHWMVIDEDSIHTGRYWSAAFDRVEKVTEEDASNELDRILRETIPLHMIADVPLGMFLSGGVDSTLVTAYMAESEASKIKTFSIGFEQSQYDELSYARIVAKRFETDHHEFIVKASAANLLPQLVSAMDEPMGDSSAIAMYHLSQLTREHVKVALCGDGGDESFGGYARHHAMKLSERFANLPAIVRLLTKVGVGAMNHSPLRERRFVRYADRYLRSSDQPFARRYASIMMHVDLQQRRALFSRDARGQLQSFDAAEAVVSAINNCSSPDALNRVLFADQQTYLPGDLLVKNDRMTMAHGLESRSPLLDHRVVEFAARLPGDLKIRGRTRKVLLKKLLQKWFPDDFIHRRKQGFAVPLAEWFRGELRPLAESYFGNLAIAEDGFLDQDAVQSLYRDHLTGAARHEHVLWSILCLEEWYRQTMRH